MRKILATLLALATLSASTQQPALQPAQPPAGSNWQHVQAFPIGASINVKALTNHASCTLKSVSDDSLTCTHGKDIVFQRADIMTIQISRRGRSALIGAAIGGGTLAVIGFASATNNTPNSFFGPNFLLGPVTAVFGLGGGLIGAITGGLTDFAKSTVYKAP